MRKRRGNIASAAVRNLPRKPGTTVIRRPRPASALRATISGVVAEFTTWALATPEANV